MSHLETKNRPSPAGRSLRSTVVVGLMAAFTSAGCGNPSAQQVPLSTANSTNSASSNTAIADILPKIINPATIAEVVGALKNTDIIGALKTAWGQGICKSQIDALTQAARNLLNISGFDLIKNAATGKATIDLGPVKAAFDEVGKCLATEVPDVFAKFTQALMANIKAGYASKVVNPEMLRVSDEELRALDPNNWVADDAAAAPAAPAAAEGPIDEAATPAPGSAAEAAPAAPETETATPAEASPTATPAP